ncbi:hypothetical protein PGT21_032080 [Puccinia graminis f. sp. tritici]|nr:hypothetical protein PGT21_032080 [Puccinia graminis f. sp. tritici]
MPGQIPGNWKYNRGLPHSDFGSPIGKCGVTADFRLHHHDSAFPPLSHTPD